jgi:NADPH-dependent 2,4-dienoyl-CoA reductase/sulfur reductase-like enzyme
MNIMGTEKLVVIGGNAAGMTAATKARRLNHRLQIKVFEKGPYVSYAS